MFCIIAVLAVLGYCIGSLVAARLAVLKPRAAGKHGRASGSSYTPGCSAKAACSSAGVKGRSSGRTVDGNTSISAAKSVCGPLR